MLGKDFTAFFLNIIIDVAVSNRLNMASWQNGNLSATGYSE